MPRSLKLPYLNRILDIVDDVPELKMLKSVNAQCFVGSGGPRH